MYVSHEEIIAIADLQIASENLVLRRDQAAVAMLYISGMRAGALLSLPIKAVDILNTEIKQWPSLGVKTKNGKHATTHLLPIPELIDVVEKWDTFIRSQCSLDQLWYPPIKNNWGDFRISKKPVGKSRNQILNKRLRKLFELAKLPYKSAHKFRRGHAIYGIERSNAIATYKAVSQNMMHANITITDSFYSSFRGADLKNKINTLTPTRVPEQLHTGGDLNLSEASNEDIANQLFELANRLKNGNSTDANYLPDKLSDALSGCQYQRCEHNVAPYQEIYDPTMLGA